MDLKFSYDPSPYVLIFSVKIHRHLFAQLRTGVQKHESMRFSNVPRNKRAREASSMHVMTFEFNIPCLCRLTVKYITRD